jgi:hypothetical protein
MVEEHEGTRRIRNRFETSQNIWLIKIPHAMHSPALAPAPAIGTQAIHVIAAATDNTGLLLATFNAPFKACLPLSEAIT